MLAGGLFDAFFQRGVYGAWRRPSRFDRNLIVIGAGAAGLVSAYIAATVKAKVTLVEAHKMGGDCLNYGCVPSKALIKTATVARQMRHARRYGLEPVEPAIDFARVMSRIRDSIARIEPNDSVERYTALGVDVLQGHARIVDPWTVQVTLPDGEQQRLTTRAIIVAAGAAPVVPEIPGMEEGDYVTTDTVWDAFAAREEAPRRLVVLGGGPVGCELAQAFSQLGSRVIQLERSARILPREDEDVAEQVTRAMERDGVDLITRCTVLRCERRGDDRFLIVDRGRGEESIAFDALLCAVGRKARLSGYGLEELGVNTESTIVTNDYLQTLFPNIYAAGDVAGPFQFTHTAAHQAWYAAVNALFGEFNKFRADYTVIPRCTFTDPEVAQVGLNEQEAKHQGRAYELTRFEISELDRAVTDSATDGFIKVLTVPGKDRILGATIVGERAGDLMAEFVLAMKHGIGLNKMLGTIHSYPTFAEANKFAAGAWKRAHAPQTVLRWLKRYHDWKRGR